MTIGWVYVAITDSFPGDCKIGFTLRSVPERMVELQRQYRTRHPFTAYDCMLVKNPRRVEWLAHQRLAIYRNPNTELFECSPEVGGAALLWAIDKVIEEHRQNPYVMQPRPKRAPKRWRRARRSIDWLTILVMLALAALLIQPAFWPNAVLPGWLPAPLLRAEGLLTRTLHPNHFEGLADSFRRANSSRSSLSSWAASASSSSGS